MPESARLQAVVASAQQAAMAGDFAAAARHLRDALALQEAELGLSHPDLASTLNNLGVVCERTGNDAEAERCYRRACEIVTAAFPAEHPFVETSCQNLAAFCESHHVPLERTAVAPPAPPSPPTPEPRQPPAPAFTPEPAPKVAPTKPPVPHAPAPRLGPLVIAGAAIVIVLLALLARSGKQAPGPTPSAATEAATTPTPTTTPVAAPPAATLNATKPASTPAAAQPAPARSSARAGADVPVLVHAELCRTLATGADWACAHPGDPVSPGAIYFYTRLTTPRDTTVVHRWYRNDKLQQSRELKIQANQGPGYRTYSRITIDPGEGGNWRVELCTTDGRVLQEERFVVR